MASGDMFIEMKGRGELVGTYQSEDRGRSEHVGHSGLVVSFAMIGWQVVTSKL